MLKLEGRFQERKFILPILSLDLALGKQNVYTLTRLLVYFGMYPILPSSSGEGISCTIYNFTRTVYSACYFKVWWPDFHLWSQGFEFSIVPGIESTPSDFLISKSIIRRLLLWIRKNLFVRPQNSYFCVATSCSSNHQFSLLAHDFLHLSSVWSPEIQ